MRPVENSCVSPLYRTGPTRASRLLNADGQSSSVAKSSPIGWCRAISSSAAVECRARRAPRSAEQARYRSAGHTRRLLEGRVLAAGEPATAFRVGRCVVELVVVVET